MINIRRQFFLEERLFRWGTRKEKLIVVLFCLVSPSQLKYLVRWGKSLKSTPLEDSVPWITYSAETYLDSILTKKMRLFEYGSGGSTLFFANRVSSVTTVEHHKGWFEKVKQTLKEKNISNVKLINIQSEQYKKGLDWTRTFYGSTRDPELTYEKYVMSIHKEKGLFDVVCVDGRSRVACVIESFDKVSKGGYIVLDNSQRKDYHTAFLYLYPRATLVKRFVGLAGYETFISETTVWRKN